MKNLMNLGKALNRNEQKEINGGEMPLDRRDCSSDSDCYLREKCIEGKCGWLWEGV